MMNIIYRYQLCAYTSLLRRHVLGRHSYLCLVESLQTVVSFGYLLDETDTTLGGLDSIRNGTIFVLLSCDFHPEVLSFNPRKTRIEYLFCLLRRECLVKKNSFGEI